MAKHRNPVNMAKHRNLVNMANVRQRTHKPCEHDNGKAKQIIKC